METATANPDQLSATIFLRTSSGKSVTELRTGPLPSNLDEYRAPAGVMDRVRSTLESKGFEVFEDSLNLMLFLKGSRSLFKKYFGEDVGAGGELLAIPEDLQAFVEVAIIMRPAEYP